MVEEEFVVRTPPSVRQVVFADILSVGVVKEIIVCFLRQISDKDPRSSWSGWFSSR